MLLKGKGFSWIFLRTYAKGEGESENGDFIAYVLIGGPLRR